MALATKQGYSAARLLLHVVEQEHVAKREKSRQLRRQRANVPEELEIETYPFKRQPKLDRKRIMSLYDGFDYMEKCRNMVWLGPTGCGKTGLATSFLLQAIDRGCRGYFITFPELIDRLFKSMADHSQDKVFRRFASFDCLVIDEVGYVEVEPAQVGQFFTLMQRRRERTVNRTLFSAIDGRRPAAVIPLPCAPFRRGGSCRFPIHGRGWPPTSGRAADSQVHRRSPAPNSSPAETPRCRDGKASE